MIEDDKNECELCRDSYIPIPVIFKYDDDG